MHNGWSQVLAAWHVRFHCRPLPFCLHKNTRIFSDRLSQLLLELFEAMKRWFLDFSRLLKPAFLIWSQPHALTADIQLSSRAATWYVKWLVKLWSICDIFVTFSIKSSFSLSIVSVTEHRKLAVVESLPSVVPIAVQQILALKVATLPCKPNQTQ